MKSKKEKSVLKNPAGVVPHVIDWDKMQTDMRKIIDAHHEIYVQLVDGGWLKDFPGGDYYTD